MQFIKYSKNVVDCFVPISTYDKMDAVQFNKHLPKADWAGSWGWWTRVEYHPKKGTTTVIKGTPMTKEQLTHVKQYFQSTKT